MKIKNTLFLLLVSFFILNKNFAQNKFGVADKSLLKELIVQLIKKDSIINDLNKNYQRKCLDKNKE
ncbi:MAG: hypothetical protein AAFZ15_22225 [Bacteroidota bacterium]